MPDPDKAHIIDRRQFGNKIDEIEAKLAAALPIYCKRTGFFPEILREDDKNKKPDSFSC